MAGKSLAELNLKDEQLPEANFEDAPEQGRFAPPPQPGRYRFKLPTDLSRCWDTIDAQKGERITAIFDNDFPLLITQAADEIGKPFVGQPFSTRINNVERPRGQDGKDGEWSALDFLLKALGELGAKPKNNAGYIAKLRAHAGQEFSADVEYSWNCRKDKDKRKMNGESIEIAVGEPGCGKRFYQNKMQHLKNPDGTWPTEITCDGNDNECGAVLRTFGELNRFGK